MILCKHISWKSQEVLQRIRETTAQAKLHRSQRIRNLCQTIGLMPGIKVEGKTIVLVDDVCTTGATLQECARVLKDHGAKRVYALVWAKD